jgi:hypothetical protein
MAVLPENWDGIGSDRTDLGKLRVGNESRRECERRT